MGKRQRGYLISFEGTEGAGKSTLIQEVHRQLREVTSQKVLITREPGGIPLAEGIRKIILSSGMNPWTELFLYEAARAEHFAQRIQPALSRHEIVLCDRFTDSTLAYQAYARGLPWAKVKVLNQMATQSTSPDLTVFLDIDPAQGLSRAKDPNRFEAEGVQFQKKVRLGFIKSRREEPRRWLTLKIKNQTPTELASKVVQEIQSRWGIRS